MYSKKKKFIIGLILLLAVSSAFAGGKKENSSSNTSNSSTSSSVRISTPIETYGSWITIFDNTNNSPLTDIFEDMVEITTTTTVTANAGTTLKFVEAQLGFENGTTITSQRRYEANLPPYSRTVIKKRAIYQTFYVIVNGSSVGSGTKAFGIGIDKQCYAL